MEVLVGADGNDTELRDFLETHFEIVPLDNVTAENAVHLRRTHHMRLPDAIIWGTAKAHNAVLVTRNMKDFNPKWEGIRLPYKL